MRRPAKNVPRPMATKTETKMPRTQPGVLESDLSERKAQRKREVKRSQMVPKTRMKLMRFLAGMFQ